MFNRAALVFQSPAQRRAPFALACMLGLGLACSGLVAAPAQAGVIGGTSEVETTQYLQYLQQVNGSAITVSGTGTVSVEPDIAKISFSTYAEEAASTQAAQAASNAAQAVSDALAEQGVDASKIQTSGVSVYPRYTYDGNSNGTITSYAANVSFEVSGIAIDDVAEVLACAMNAGANQVDSLAYYSSTYDEAYQQALALAIEQARGKAQTMANASLSADAAESLVLESIEEQGSYQQYRYADTGAFESEASSDSMAVSAADISGAVQPGIIEIEASVSATYRAWDVDAFEALSAATVAGDSEGADIATSSSNS